jgi:hypothetical protein
MDQEQRQVPSTFFAAALEGEQHRGKLARGQADTKAVEIVFHAFRREIDQLMCCRGWWRLPAFDQLEIGVTLFKEGLKNRRVCV